MRGIAHQHCALYCASNIVHCIPHQQCTALRINILRGIAHQNCARHCASTFGAELRIKHSAQHCAFSTFCAAFAHQHCARHCASNVVHSIAHQNFARHLRINIVRGIAHQHCAQHGTSTLCSALRINIVRCIAHQTLCTAFHINIVRDAPTHSTFLILKSALKANCENIVRTKGEFCYIFRARVLYYS